MNRFFPDGRHALNRTAWRGKEPRTCAVTKMNGTGHGFGTTVFDVEVTYRPKGWTTYVGDTKYDGWTALVLKKAADGTLLGKDGGPLPAGEEPVYLPYEVYPDLDFNELDFGEFVGESESVGVGHIDFAELMKQVHANGEFHGSVNSEFVAPRRERQEVRILVTDLHLAPVSHGGITGTTRNLVISRKDPQFRHRFLDHLHEVVAGYIEGRYTLKNLISKDIHLVELEGTVMEFGGAEDSVTADFDVLPSLVSTEDLDDIARRLTAVYAVDVTVVQGEQIGFVLRRTPLPKH